MVWNYRFGTSKKVAIIKLPPRTTDRLQPLDVAVFKSVNDHWGDVLLQRNNTSRLILSKAEFATILSSEDVWKKSFSIENIQKRFKKCGIYPAERESYPQEQFNPNLKKRYDIWGENGKPELTGSELDDLENEAFKNKEVVDIDDGISLNETTLTSFNNISTTGTPTIYKGKKVTVINYFIPDNDPTNLIRMENQQVSSSSSRASTPVNTNNFKSIVLKKLDNLVAGNKEKKIEKRRKANPHGEIVTSDEVFEVVCEKEENKKQKTNVELFATQTRKRKSNGRKIVEQDIDEDIADENIDILEDDSDSSNESNDYSVIAKRRKT